MLQSHPLDAMLDAAVAAGVAPGVVAAVARSEGVTYAHAAGLRCTQPRRAMQVDSAFRIASMTKLVTSLAVMMLVEEGRIELDAPLASYVPGYRQPGVLRSFDAASQRYVTEPADRPITIRQLLTHTAGFGYWFLDAPLLALTQGAPELLNPPFLMYPPGQRFSYGTSLDVLGQIFAPVAGVPLDVFLAKRIFAPLGMQDTSYELPRDRARLVTLQTRGFGTFAERPNEWAGGPPFGGTGLYSTARDYTQILRLLLNGGELDGHRLLGGDHIGAMMRNQIGALYAERPTTALPERSNDFVFMDGTQKFGFGGMVETRDRRDGRSAGSLGWGGIYNTYFWVDPHADLAAVVLMQTSPFADPASIAFCERFEAAVYA